MANRPTLNGKPVALKGDKTSTGGVILEGLDNHTVHGTPVAREGDKVWCPACKQTGTITTGAGMAGTKVNGIPFAVHGSAVTCGCSNHTVISPGQASKTTLSSSAVTEAEPEQHAQATKKPNSGVDAITLVIGVFFDGTGNNAVNTRSRLDNCTANEQGLNDEEAISVMKQCRANDFGKIGDIGRTSYDGYYTNIHYLHEMYLGNEVVDNSVQLAVYVPGIGTRNDSKDSKISMALGLLDEGVVGNTDFAIDEINKGLKSLLNEIHVKNISNIKFDIFGFSRGAAAARHFANRVNKNDRAIIQAVTRSLDDVSCGVNLLSSNLKNRFLGLFDTVAAIGSITDGFNVHDSNIGDADLYLPVGVADYVFQLVAMHECRYNFSLNSVKPGYPELSIPGVHSDIGGGYNPIEEEFYFISRPRFIVENRGVPDDETQAYKDAIDQQLKLKMYDNIRPLMTNANVSVQTWSDDFVSKNDFGIKKRVGAAVTLKRQVSNALSTIPLNIMLDAAKDAGVYFVQEAESLYPVPDELLSVFKKMLIQSRAIRFGGSVGELSCEDMDLLGKYIHCSANWNSVMLDSKRKITGAVKASELISFVNRPGEQWKRSCFDLNGRRV
ncbi:DUF2235 domain-containing protein [Pantoea sp. EA-12]|uniref:phospholipase effector Tle1 domain-containing protein n=1 Tax=Pantoea sp. EA-12 TaxID=3043303 RepID=UPI0024B51C17|nr:DUF2235 domain-containing protein [Pantoea sp. EA-12]MDI9220481.1 DUF2235 domain-containing protein [Pantoea sp. EA-12]